MKFKKKFSAAVVALALAVGLVGGAGAATAQQKITATLRPDITIKLDGEAKIFTNEKGDRVYPIMYQGTTYLPIRAASGLVGLQVGWDQATQTVLLGSKPAADGVDLIDAYDNYLSEGGGDAWVEQHKSKENKTVAISGIECSHWIMFYMGYNNHGVTTKTSFNVEGKYDTLTFQYYSDKDVTLKIFGDNDSLLYELAIPGGKVAQTVTVPLLKTSQLTFYAERPSRDIQGVHTYIFNASLK